MKLFDTDSFQEIWATISRNKFRSIATGFGVFWGLFMLIVLLALGNKLSQSMMSQIEGAATNSAFIWPNRTTEPFKGFRKGRYWEFQTSDIQYLRDHSHTVDIISPLLFGGGDRNVVRGEKSGSHSFSGIYPNYFDMIPVTLEQGRLLNEVDVADMRKVCLIGKTVYETLFNPGEDPDGQFIRLNGIYFQVVGVVSRFSSGVSIGSPIEETVYIPFSTHQRLFRRSDNFGFLGCTSVPGYTAADMELEVKALLRTAHDISPTDTNAVGGFNLERQFKVISTVFLGINILMWIVGLGALLSGIIGISNIMLVTVRERMREIGVRRALGAKPWNIIVQIMSESFVLTAMAGMIGFLLGVAMSLFIEKLPINFGGGPPPAPSGEPVVSFGLALTAMGVLIASGLMAGLLPALRALRIKAIDAIRDE